MNTKTTVVLAATLVTALAAACIGAEKTTVTCKPLQQTRVAPVSLEQIAPGHYFIDFGKDSFAALELGFKAGSTGCTVEVHLGEALAAPRTVDRNPGNGKYACIRHHQASIVLRDSPGPYTVPLPERDQRRMPRNIGPVMPFRYVELLNAPALDPEKIRQVVAHYEFNDEAADFNSSDPKLNAIWAMCKHTIKATSFCGVFVDGDRERLPYEADAYINQLGWYGCTDDLTLPRYSHEYLITHPTWPTEWKMFSVLMAHADFWQTGDITSVKAFYDQLKAKTLIHAAREDGLISTVKPLPPRATGKVAPLKSTLDIVDWPPGERDGYQMMPVNTVVNAFHCRALHCMAELAEAAGQPGDARYFREAAVKATRALNDTLVDPVTGLYVDGEGSGHSSLHANMFPLAFGLVPAERKVKVAAFIQTRGMACSVYGAQFLMEALFENGLASPAIALMTADGNRSWTHMVERVGTTMTLEAWDMENKRNMDWNHAWGAAPANILPRQVLGVQPLAPGFARIAIQPQPGPLTWAEGKVPTPRGPVRVRFERPSGAFALTLEIPADTTAKVRVPKLAGATLSLDGKDVPADEAGGCLVLESVGAGQHKILSR